MKTFSTTLYLEINNLNFIFFTGEIDEQNNFNIIHKLKVPIVGIENNRIFDFEKVFKEIKENIYLIEQNLNHTFKEIVLILENFNLKFINFTGFKKLNGSQVLRENITYILNTLKSEVDTIETNYTILHIFNSKFYLDKKEHENLPIGLFGNFYSHELSFVLIDNNDYKNLLNIFEKCNLKLNKILVKSFIENACISEENEKINSFYQIKVNNDKSKIIYFENNSIKFEQEFNFGNDIVINDICKITSLKKETVNFFLSKTVLRKDLTEHELVEEKFFDKINYRKIKKKLIYDIADARIEEISKRILSENINLSNYNKKVKVNFLLMSQRSNSHHFKDLYAFHFSANNFYTVKTLENTSYEKLIKKAYEIVHFGWKKEVIPITHTKKTTIARFFDLLFN